MNSQFELSLRARGVAVDAGVNDAPFLRVRGGRSASSRMPVDMWLAPEGNALTASISPLDDGDESPLVELMLAPSGSALPPLVRLSWSAPRGSTFEPFRIELPFAPGAPVRTRLWRDVADPVELDDAALDEARATGLHLCHAMARRDLDAVMELVRYRTDETARAFGFDEDENVSAVRRAFESLLLAPGFALAPVVSEDLRVNPVAGERAFHLTRSDGRELVVTRGAPEQTMQVYVAPVAGSWRVVR